MRKWIEKAVASFVKGSTAVAPKMRRADADQGAAASPKIDSSQAMLGFKASDMTAGENQQDRDVCPS
jgi:hypothetical protein